MQQYQVDRLNKFILDAKLTPEEELEIREIVRRVASEAWSDGGDDQQEFGVDYSYTPHRMR